MFLKHLVLIALIFANYLIAGLKQGRKTGNQIQKRATNFPVKAGARKRVPVPMNSRKIEKRVVINRRQQFRNAKPAISANAKELQLNLINKIGRYNKEYMIEYKKMIASLSLDSKFLDPLFNSREMLPGPNEIKTVKALYSTKMENLPICSPQKERLWKKIKVLQEEKKNSVTLKKNIQTGARVVEKSMEGQKHYDKELKFFSQAHHGSNRYFPAFICSAKPQKKNERYSIITDFVDGDKSHVMASMATPEQLKHMVAQFFNSIVELHRVGFIHCDLSPANVMVTKDFDVKLIDFGMALPVGQANGYRGSYYIRAPELHEMCPGKIDVAIDWWAFGVTVSIWHYYHYNPEALLKTDHTYQFTPMRLKGKKFSHGEFPQQFSPELRKLLSLFLTCDPEYRTFSTVRLQNIIKNHEYFKGFDWSTAVKY